jgi:hypothetical protein
MLSALCLSNGTKNAPIELSFCCFFDIVGQIRVGIQILKNVGSKLKPVLKKNGLFVFNSLRTRRTDTSHVFNIKGLKGEGE